jgi:hypothetical protein
VSLTGLVRKLRRPGLVTPVYEEWLLRSNGNPVFSQETVDRLNIEMMKPPRVRSGSFSASAQTTCHRAQVFGVLGAPAKPLVDTTLTRIFIDGQWRHLAWQAAGLESGFLTRIEVPTKLHRPSDGLLVARGTLDGVNDPMAFGFELKGIRSLSWVDEGPLPPHQRQVAVYFAAMPTLERFSIVYDEKGSQEYREFVVERDEAPIAEALEDLETLDGYRIRRELPPILKECEQGASPTFRRCAYSGICLGYESYDQAGATERVSRIRRR